MFRPSQAAGANCRSEQTRFLRAAKDHFSGFGDAATGLRSPGPGCTWTCLAPAAHRIPRHDHQIEHFAAVLMFMKQGPAMGIDHMGVAEVDDGHDHGKGRGLLGQDILVSLGDS